jgi:hypothetical protein
MCYVPSWIESEGKIYYLTDKDVISYHEHKKPGQKINYNDFTGHSGIKAVLGVSGTDKENFPCPKEILDKILSGKMDNICRKAENIESWPKEMIPILAKLSQDDDYRVRWRVAENPNTPADILAKLSQDDDYHVRWGVAENPNYQEMV